MIAVLLDRGVNQTNLVDIKKEILLCFGDYETWEDEFGNPYFQLLNDDPVAVSKRFYELAELASNKV